MLVRQRFESCMIDLLTSSSSYNKPPIQPSTTPSSSTNNTNTTTYFQYNTTLSTIYLHILHTTFVTTWLDCHNPSSHHHNHHHLQNKTMLYTGYHLTTRSCHYASNISTSSIAFTNLRIKYQDLLTQCFAKTQGNTQAIRSKALGYQHLDKSIYYDQLIRWFINFAPSQFQFVNLPSLSHSPKHTLLRMFEKWQIRHKVCDKEDSKNPQLHKSVNKSSSQQQQHKLAQLHATPSPILLSSSSCPKIEQMKFKQLVRLSKPNALANQVKNQLPAKYRKELELFFKPYNLYLNELLMTTL